MNMKIKMTLVLAIALVSNAAHADVKCSALCGNGVDENYTLVQGEGATVDAAVAQMQAACDPGTIFTTVTVLPEAGNEFDFEFDPTQACHSS